MKNKRHWLEKWKVEMCKGHDSAKCLCNALDCHDCLYNPDFNLINCEEAIDYLR